MTRRAVVILNPKAGAGRALRTWSRVRSSLRSLFDDVDEWASERPGHATELARRAVERGAAAIIAVGGDGTIHEVVNGMAESVTPLGILPFGTGNDFARALGISPAPAGALAVIAGRHARRVDLGRVHGQFYVQVAGTGFDAVVAERVNRGGRAGSGAVTYVRHLLATLITYRNTDSRLCTDGDAADPGIQGKVLLLAVANTAYYGGGMKICPGARPDDGLLDWCRIGDMNKLEVLRALPRVFGGTHVRLPKVDTGRAASVLVEGPPDLPVHADGELVGTLPARFECVPGALSVFTPAPAQGS